jgi:hypothetical protein
MGRYEDQTTALKALNVICNDGYTLPEVLESLVDYEVRDAIAKSILMTREISRPSIGGHHANMD